MDTGPIAAVLERVDAEGWAPGAVAVVATGDSVEYLGAAGWSDAEARVPLRADAVFRVASLTKAVVAVAVLRQIERRVVSLDTPVGDVLPAFDELPVLEGYDGDRPRLRPPRRRATLRHLMTHTSGLTYDTFSEDLTRYCAESGIPMPGSGLLSCFRTPLVFDPGEAWAYGMSTDWTGRVLETLTGQPLDVHLRETVLEPLGLRDVAFTRDADQRARTAPVHQRTADGGFAAVEFEYPEAPEFFSAGHGLHATAADYAAIQQLLLNGGGLRGVRLLEPASVDLLSSDQLGGVRIGPLRSTRAEFSYDLELGSRVTWGLDTLIATEGEPGMRAAGSFGWCGTFNSYYWIDRRSGVSAAVHMQYLPFFDPGARSLVSEFERAVYAGLS